MFKQVIVLRTDLKMSVGKKCVQVAHASVNACLKANKKIVKKWSEEGQKKVVVKVNSRRKLLKLYEKAKKKRIPCFLVSDAGLTELRPGTVTALGIGPAEEEKIDEITGKLKLL